MLIGYERLALEILRHPSLQEDRPVLYASHSLEHLIAAGAVQESTQQWTAACLDEAWVIISQEDADSANVNIAALRADIDALLGEGA